MTPNVPASYRLAVESRLTGSWETVDHRVTWPGLVVETVVASTRTPFSFAFTGDWALLSIGMRGHRSDGETIIDSLPPSRRRSLDGTMVFVPPGANLQGWSVPSVCSRWLNIYIAPRVRTLNGEICLRDLALEPRLHFIDASLQATVGKLKALSGWNRDDVYAETLGALLVAELRRVLASHANGRRGPPAGDPDLDDRSPSTGRLEPWRERKLRDFIEANLAKALRVKDLADLVGLTPLHLIRAFKASVGVPPHRYITVRRIERAKSLLTHPANSITEVALACGFGSSSHFSQSFRQTVGLTATAFRRSLLG